MVAALCVAGVRIVVDSFIHFHLYRPVGSYHHVPSDPSISYSILITLFTTSGTVLLIFTISVHYCYSLSLSVYPYSIHPYSYATSNPLLLFLSPSLIPHTTTPHIPPRTAPSRRNPREARRHWLDSVVNEGLAYYFEEVTLHAGLYDDTPRLRETM